VKHHRAAAAVVVNSEDSAQGSTARPNSLVAPSLDLVKRHLGGLPLDLRVADQGCGRLRHLRAIAAEFDHLWLVDQAVQLDRNQVLYAKRQSIRSFVAGLGDGVAALSDVQFRVARLNLDAIFSFCVYDVVTASVRKQLAVDAAANLREGGLYVLVIPRNDQTLLKRCSDKNAYEDGHLSARNGSVTFYANFRDSTQVAQSLSGCGFRLVEDRSIYRYVWLALEKARPTPD
jgi:SAM-dependent methyltransferase